ARTVDTVWRGRRGARLRRGKCTADAGADDRMGDAVPAAAGVSVPADAGVARERARTRGGTRRPRTATRLIPHAGEGGARPAHRPQTRRRALDDIDLQAIITLAHQRDSGKRAAQLKRREQVHALDAILRAGEAFGE